MKRKTDGILVDSESKLPILKTNHVTKGNTNLFIRWQIHCSSDPCKFIDRYIEMSSDNFFGRDQIQSLFEAIQCELCRNVITGVNGVKECGWTIQNLVKLDRAQKAIQSTQNDARYNGSDG